MIVASDDRQGRKRMRNWRGSAIGAGLTIGLQLLATTDGFNPPLQAPGGGRLSLEQRRGLRSTCCSTRWERLRSTVSTRAARGRTRVGRLDGAAGNDAGSAPGNAAPPETPHRIRQQQQRVNGDGMDDRWKGNIWDVGGGGGGTAGRGVEGGVYSGGVTAGTAAAGPVSTEESMLTAAKQSVPLKIMVFIDGTWLYYSFFGRGDRCHISAKLGPGWIGEYKVKWEMLPVIISRALYAQLARFNQPSRLVEVVRTVVFSSARKDTDKDSDRMQMFEAMREKNFEVHMATTMGVQEKCVDIALAVEMMHYATIPDTFDVGVLVTGDKDFMPAMARTRQKGRRICLCSMRNSCNQDLLKDDARVMDFEPVWINEYIDDLMEYDPTSVRNGIAKAKVPKVAPEVLCQLILRLMDQRGGHITSRDLGRELNMTTVDKEGTKALSVIKDTWQSITKFLLEHSDVFQTGETRRDPNDPTISEYTISKVDSQNSMKSLKLGEVMDEPVSEDDAAYTDVDTNTSDDDVDNEEERESIGHGETQESLSREVVPQLKTRLRERGLPTSGKKADLIARLLESMDAEDLAATPPERHSGSPPPPSGLPGPADTTTTQETALLSDPSSKAVAAEELEHDAGAANGGGGGGVDGLSEGWAAAAADALIAGDFSSSRLEVPGDGGGGGGGGGEGGPVGPPRGGFSAESAARDRRVSGHATLVNLVSQCLDNVKHAQGGGVVSSRDLGRALAALPSPSHPSQSALLLLKSKWPSLMAFLKACPSEFTVTGMGNRKEFGIARNDGGGWEARGRVEGAGGEERSHRAPVGVTPVAADQ